MRALCNTLRLVVRSLHNNASVVSPSEQQSHDAYNRRTTSATVVRACDPIKICQSRIAINLYEGTFHNRRTTTLKQFTIANFSKSRDRSLTMHDGSHLFCAMQRSHQVASDNCACSVVRGNSWRPFLLH